MKITRHGHIRQFDMLADVFDVSLAHTKLEADSSGIRFRVSDVAAPGVTDMQRANKSRYDYEVTISTADLEALFAFGAHK